MHAHCCMVESSWAWKKNFFKVRLVISCLLFCFKSTKKEKNRVFSSSQWEKSLVGLRKGPFCRVVFCVLSVGRRFLEYYSSYIKAEAHVSPPPPLRVECKSLKFHSCIHSHWFRIPLPSSPLCLHSGLINASVCEFQSHQHNDES